MKTEDKPLILDKIADNILKNISSEITTITFSVQSDFEYNADCVSINNPEILSRLKKGNVVKSEEVLLSYQKFVPFKIRQSGKKIFKIFSSDGFSDKSVYLANCEIVDDKIKINSVKIENYSLETRIDYLFEFYKNNYEKLKEILEIPKDLEFEFDFVYENSTVKSTSKTEINSDIFSKKISFQYFNDSASLHSGEIDLRIWS